VRIADPAFDSRAICLIGGPVGTMQKSIGNSSTIGEARKLASSLRRYSTVMLALLRREEDARRHAPFETVLNLMEPLVLIALITSARYLLERLQLPPIGDSLLLFYGTGFFAKYFFTYVSRRMGGPIRSARRRFPIEQRLDHLIIHAFMRTLDYSLMGVVLFGVLYAVVTPDAFPHDFVPIAESCIALALLGLGFGMINLVLTDFIWIWGYVVPTVNRSLILFSGIFYIPDFMPETARYILSFNPLVHAVAMFRQGFYPQYPDLILDKLYLFTWVACALLAGFMLERVSRRFEAR
jgi:capsular polysaccharide transport system permease protein